MASIDLGAVEARTLAIGRHLYDRMRSEGESLFSAETWTSRLIDWSIRHEEARLQLFRFIDVLPALGSDEEKIRHLKEYFDGRADPFSGLLKLGLSLSRIGPFAQRVVATSLQRAFEQVAKSFIAASNPEEAARVVRELRRAGQGFTLDLLGEATLSQAEADRCRDRYIQLLDVLTQEASTWSEDTLVDRAPWGALPKVNLSVKLTALEPRFDPICPTSSIANLLSRLRPIASLAVKRRVHLHIDAEEHARKDLIEESFKRLAAEEEFRSYPHLGLVIQAYLKESYEGAQRLIAWAKERGTPIWVRLVKGAYWDYETVRARHLGWPVPVFVEKRQTDANFEKLCRLLLENHDAVRLAVATHNIRSMAYCMALRDEMGLPKGAVEFQFLFGMATPLQRTLTRLGERVRVYTTYGETIPGMAYLVRRLLENTSNESFLRKGFAEKQPIEALLAAPEEKSERKGDVSPERRAKPPQSDAFSNHPLLDFSRHDVREAFQAAFSRIRQTWIGRRYPLLIGDDQVETGGWLLSKNPSFPAEIIGEAASAVPSHAEHAVTTAVKAFRSWKRTPAKRRAEILFRAADAMADSRFELAATIVLEAGKPWREADADVAEAIDFLRYYGGQADSLGAPLGLGPSFGEVNEYCREPRGVVAVIAPWNFPLAILTGMTAAGLATGNTVVVKPAEQTPIIAYHMVRILREAGVPNGAINYLPGPGETVGRALVEHPDVSVIAFTGSRQVGLWIARRAAELAPGQKNIKRVIAEMGGKNAIIVDDDADLDEAVQGVVSSAFGFAGQKCSACSRVIAVRGVYDAFVERLVEAAKSLPLGPAERPDTVVGPVVSLEAKDRIEGVIERARQTDRLLWSGELSDELAVSGGYFVPCAIFGDVSNHALVAKEEIFGPVLACMRAATFGDALEIALDSEYALTGGLFSRSPAHVRLAREAFRVGNLYINRGTTGALVGRQPFGGLAHSGMGFKAGGPDYLLQFTEARTITENTLRRGFASDDTFRSPKLT